MPILVTVVFLVITETQTMSVPHAHPILMLLMQALPLVLHVVLENTQSQDLPPVMTVSVIVMLALMVTLVTLALAVSTKIPITNVLSVMQAPGLLQEITAVLLAMQVLGLPKVLILHLIAQVVVKDVMLVPVIALVVFVLLVML